MEKELQELKEKVSDLNNRTHFGYCYLSQEEEFLVNQNFTRVNVKECDLNLEWYPIFMDGRTHIGGTYGPMSMASLGYRFICFETMQMRGETEYEYYHKNNIHTMSEKKKQSML